MVVSQFCRVTLTYILIIKETQDLINTHKQIAITSCYDKLIGRSLRSPQSRCTLHSLFHPLTNYLSISSNYLPI